MTQRISIRNFGPVEEVDLDVNDLLVFIGAQASGKSTVSKAIFFFKSLRDDLTSHLYQAYEHKKFDESVALFAKRAKQKFIKIYGPVSQFPEMHLEFQYGNGMKVTVQPSSDPRYTDVIFDEIFRQKFRDLVKDAKTLSDELQQKSLRFSSSREISAMKAREAGLLSHIENEANKLFNDDRDLIFLPAGRSLIATLSQQRYNIDMGESDLDSDGLIKLDYLMQNFINRIDNAKPIFSQTFSDFIEDNTSACSTSDVKNAITLAQELVDSILKGSYRYQNGIERIDFGNGNNASINFASSGQQEVVWILLLVILLVIDQRNVFLVVEEPEAHLFPLAQKEMVDLLALLSNQSSNQIIITTHSPYILSALNNLLYAHQVGSSKPQEVEEIVDRQLWVNPEKVSAFILESGSVRSIMDDEMNLIESAEIDRVSSIIVDTFDRLFELEN